MERKGGYVMQPIHILHLVRPAEGGILQHVRHLLHAFSPFCRITVACPSESRLYREAPEGIGRMALPLCDGWDPRRDLAASLRLKAWMEKHPVDILHMHGAKAAAVGRVAARLMKKRPRLVYTLHNFVEPKRTWQKKIYLGLERWLLPDTDCLITVSHVLADVYKRQLNGASEKMRTIYNGTVFRKDLLSRAEAHKFMGLPEDRFVIGTISRLIPEKGIRELLLAFAKVCRSEDSLMLAIIGEGPDRPRLERMVREIALEGRVRFLGHIPDAARLIQGFDLCVIPSLREGFGFVAVEAMMAGVPLIATNAGGLAEVVRHGETGLLVEPGNPDKLAEAMKGLYRDPQTRQRLGYKGRAYAAAHFTLSRMIEETWDVYRFCLQERGLFDASRISQ
jgi:glycosyltransferase involved in cell wall biosynthesis